VCLRVLSLIPGIPLLFSLGNYLMQIWYLTHHHILMQDFGLMEVLLGQKATSNIPHHVSIEILEKLNETNPSTIDNTNIRKIRKKNKKKQKQKQNQQIKEQKEKRNLRFFFL